MNHSSARSLARVLVFLLASYSWQQVQAQNYFPVIPGRLADDSFSTIPFSGGSATVRYQQIYDAAGFIEVGGDRPFLIHTIDFRSDAGHPGFFSRFPDFQINLSTTSSSVDGLSTMFAGNVGPDNTAIIPRGAFNYGVNGVGDFSSITLATPFLYDPSQGNLLLDIRNFGGGTTSWGVPPFMGLAYVDASNVAGDRVSSLFANDVNAASGTTSTLGLVTQFWITPVPEPSALALLAVGIGVSVVGLKRMRPGKGFCNVFTGCTPWRQIRRPKSETRKKSTRIPQRFLTG